MSAPSDTKAEWETELELAPEWLRVRKWREQQLEAAGFSAVAAFHLATCPGVVSYHEATDMLARGATEAQVLHLLVD